MLDHGLSRRSCQDYVLIAQLVADIVQTMVRRRRILFGGGFFPGMYAGGRLAGEGGVWGVGQGKSYTGEQDKEWWMGLTKRTSLFCDQIHRVLL